MKRLWIVAVFLCALTPFAFAQRGGGSRIGGIGNWGGGRGFAGGGRGFAGGGRFAGDRFGRSNFNNFNGGFGWLGYGGWGFPYLDDYDYGQQDSPTVVVPVTIQFVAPPPPPPPPPDPARLAVRTYVWPDTGVPESVNTFAILTKDGAMRSAIAAWVQGNELRYRTTDGGGGRVPISQIDREATLRANDQRGLKLWLP